MNTLIPILVVILVQFSCSVSASYCIVDSNCDSFHVCDVYNQQCVLNGLVIVGIVIVGGIIGIILCCVLCCTACCRSSRPVIIHPNPAQNTVIVPPQQQVFPPSYPHQSQVNPQNFERNYWNPVIPINKFAQNNSH